MAQEKYNPLISVGVIAYNSSEFILDLLESIKAQTYQNIELIVSDDKSSDNTVSICEEWIAQNKDRFVRTEVIVPEQNTGTAGNYNRALFAAKGEWIKFIDGDDLLFPNCLDDNIDFVTNHPEAKVVFSDILYFEDAKNPSSRHFVSEEEKLFFEKDAHEQFMVVLKKNHIPPSSSFMKTKMLKENPYQEEYGIVEDAPKWIDLTKKGYKFYYFDKVTTGYRDCISATRQRDRFFSPLLYECAQKYFWNEKLGLIKQYHHQEAYNYGRKQLLTRELAFAMFDNKKTFLSNILFFCVRVYIKLFVHYKLH